MIPQIQHPAPAFKTTAVVDGSFQQISLDDYRGKWVLLAFIPMAFTFACPTEVIAFSDAASHFNERGAHVLFCSVDSEYSLLAWTNTDRKLGGVGPVNIPLMSDKNHKIARDYGVLIEDAGIALRGLFLIDPNGILRQITINDLPVGRSTDEAIRLLDAFLFVETHGEARVCPANWQKGQKTIKPDVKASKEYFSSAA
ncbi:Peroxiredoxin TSA1 [Neolecta irregularis DAH-3]|uniref:thioredoxin-dependent peroxiredoxin n=1 Tax=Neolecta irregularis (strain DAH-3) TaxID=1198029 RepID=A0A1U7LHS8_NEOID|nr:Peroxiredoxin TSA1 [Neolecta irregularis DAH-3]|eukprot:OLL22081.1 Peroxiredoxin TSA1 [Neolecta irregularis DAH-3]